MAIKLAAIDNMLKRFGKLDRNKIVRGVLKDSTSLQQDIVALDTEDQLYEKGITADGISLGEYAPATIYGTSNFQGKIQKGQRHDHITLKDTGATYESAKIKIEGSDFKIAMDTDIHGVDLVEKFGNIVGLTDENKMVVAGWVKAPFVNAIRKAVWK